MDRKKDFQKTIAEIRKDSGKEFQKAMMTGQQQAKNTATVNCGGEWGSPTSTGNMAATIMEDKRFREFLRRHNATATIERVGRIYPYYQIRITFKEA